MQVQFILRGKDKDLLDQSADIYQDFLLKWSFSSDYVMYLYFIIAETIIEGGM